MDTTLLIMAAGIGSRYGTGIKQLEGVGLHKELIIDYSIHDAIVAGFNSIVIVIRKDIEAVFRERIGNRVEQVCKQKGVALHYAFQDLKDIPGILPEGRIKPWGTGQAVLAAKAFLTNPFLAINADDYYGKEAFFAAHTFLAENHKPNECCMAGFLLKNTLSENGGVTRGLCQVENERLTDIVETRHIVKTASGAEADGVAIDGNRYVSMNFWGFQPGFVQTLESGFADFFCAIEQGQTDPLTAEYLLPILIGQLLQEKKVTVKVFPTGDRWFGVTYKEDKEAVESSFRELIASGIYGEDLYADLR